MSKLHYPVKQCFAWIGPRIFYREFKGFLNSFMQLLNPMLGSSFIANFRHTENGPRGVT